MNRPISTPSTSNMNVAAVTRWPSKLSSGTEDRLPGAVVEVGNRSDQSGSVSVSEVEQAVEVPVQVVGEVGDLVPQGLLRVQPHRSPLARRGHLFDVGPG